MSHNSNEFEDSEAISVSGKIMFAAIILLFVAIVLVLLLHLYSKWVWARQATRSPTRRRLTFAPARDSVLAPRRGLDPSIIRSLPVLVFTPTQFKDGLECAVCLCELSDGEKARLLPKCNHGFHLDCIDMWFLSHSTCPLCRNPVALEFSAAPKSDDPELGIPEVNLADGHSTDSPNFPTNVLFWGDENQVNARRSGALEEGTSSSPLAASTSSATKMERYGSLVIEIPRLVAESLSPPSSLPSPSIHFAEDESKSPMPTRLRSLRRLLSRETRVSPCSPNAGDFEQGEPAVSNA